jgi:hypothetical protein
MKMSLRMVVFGAILATCGWAQIASGAGDIGKGAAKGVGNVAKGTGKGALDLVTLHPINAATSVGKGAGLGARDVTAGTVKGTAKIGKGIGKGIKKIL